MSPKPFDRRKLSLYIRSDCIHLKHCQDGLYRCFPTIQTRGVVNCRNCSEYRPRLGQCPHCGQDLDWHQYVGTPICIVGDSEQSSGGRTGKKYYLRCPPPTNALHLWDDPELLPWLIAVTDLGKIYTNAQLRTELSASFKHLSWKAKATLCEILQHIRDTNRGDRELDGLFLLIAEILPRNVLLGVKQDDFENDEDDLYFPYFGPPGPPDEPS
ncbi:MAG: hypothetical protein ACFFBD_01525 [Candidatus Hodarchaeota archaeon]